jgi:phage-related protein
MTDEYEIKFYADSQTGKSDVFKYLKNLDVKDRTKVNKYIKHLQVNKGYLEEPYSKHITGKIRELRVDFFHNHHRVFYFAFVGKNIILLHAFLKKTQKTPPQEIKRALDNYNDFIINQSTYEE